MNCVDRWSVGKGVECGEKGRVNCVVVEVAWVGWGLG